MAGAVNVVLIVTLFVFIAAIETGAVTYKWDQWTSWTHCNASCSGTTYRIRACLRHQSNQSDHSTDISRCNFQGSGPFDYDRKSCGPACDQSHWSLWSTWSQCSSTCDEGVRYRARHCEQGDSCKGDVFEQEVCTITKCIRPVDGLWSEWGSWGKCSTSCGLGYNVRYRSCDNPTPKDGGADCAGKHDQVRVCPTVHCPIDGQWGNYTTNPCTVTCGVGVLVSLRKCDNPPPQYNGAACVGSATKFGKCINSLCAVDGKWTEWSNYTDCQVVCGDGHVTRTRTCTNPPPQNSGKDCSGDIIERQTCNNGQCPRDIKLCDKDQILNVQQSIASNSTLSPSSTICNSKIAGEPSSFSLLDTYCSVPADRSKWHLGVKIRNNCELIPLYSPVGSSDNGVHVKEVGVMTDCFGDTLQMVSCDSDVTLKSYNLTATLTSLHMLLFEN